MNLMNLKKIINLYDELLIKLVFLLNFSRNITKETIGSWELSIARTNDPIEIHDYIPHKTVHDT